MLPPTEDRKREEHVLDRTGQARRAWHHETRMGVKVLRRADGNWADAPLNTDARMFVAKVLSRVTCVMVAPRAQRWTGALHTLRPRRSGSAP